MMDIRRTPMTRAHYGLGNGKRDVNSKRALVIHATAGTNSFDWLRNGGSAAGPVSCHYLIVKDGTIWQYTDVQNSLPCPDDLVMWHAGPSTWMIDGKRIPDAQGLNPVSIGIEIENRNNGSDPYPDVQYQAVVEVSRLLIERYNIPLSQVVRHVDIAPGRKTDPVGFPWERFQHDLSIPTQHTMHTYLVVTPSATVYEEHDKTTIALNGTAFLPNGNTFTGYESHPGIIHREDGLGFVSTDNLARLNGMTLIRSADVTVHSSLMSGIPACTIAQAKTHILAHPTGEYTEHDVDVILGTYATRCAETGLDFGMVVAQMILETGNLASFWASRPQRNPAGIGVDGTHQKAKPVEYLSNWAYNSQRQRWERGLSFPSWTDDSIPVHVGRLLAYVLVDDAVQDTPAQPEDIRTWHTRCRELIERALAVRAMPKQLRGTVQELCHLSVAHNPMHLGWATDPDYADKIVRIVNTIRRI